MPLAATAVSGGVDSTCHAAQQRSRGSAEPLPVAARSLGGGCVCSLGAGGLGSRARAAGTHYRATDRVASGVSEPCVPSPRDWMPRPGTPSITAMDRTQASSWDLHACLWGTSREPRGQGSRPSPGPALLCGSVQTARPRQARGHGRAVASGMSVSRPGSSPARALPPAWLPTKRALLIGSLIEEPRLASSSFPLARRVCSCFFFSFVF